MLRGLIFVIAIMSGVLGVLASCGDAPGTPQADLPPATVIILPAVTSTGVGSALETQTPAIRSTASRTLSPSTRRPGTAPPQTIPTGFETIAESALPPQARETMQLIESDGPFPYRQDGQVFQNREGILPKKPVGHYREYTVVTPGSPDRGARRIIRGKQGEMFYTADHYASFKLIVPDE